MPSRWVGGWGKDKGIHHPGTCTQQPSAAFELG
jgi:hypothetical protein